MNDYARNLADLTAEYQDILANMPQISMDARKKAMSDCRNRDLPKSELLAEMRAKIRQVQDEYNRARALRTVRGTMPWE